MANTLEEILDSLKETPKMEKWEYKRERMSVVTDYIKLNELGERGWELCGIDYKIYIFKRKIQ